MTTNRRDYLGMLAAGLGPLSGNWREQIWSETDPPSTTETPALRDFLIPASTIDDSFRPVSRGLSGHNCVPPDRYLSLENHNSENSEQALNQYTVTTGTDAIGHIQYEADSKQYVASVGADLIETEQNAAITTTALKPITSEEIETTPADLHQYLYDVWLGSGIGSIPDAATDWVEVHSNEQTTPDRWTECLIRQPVLYLDPELPEFESSERPYFELTRIIATVDWGVLSVNSRMLQFGEEDQAFHVLKDITEELWQQARDATAPTFE